MFNERAFIARVEAAGPEELAALLGRPSVDEEKALRAHLGDGRYQRMHGMALKRNISRSIGRRKKGNVLVIHGIMGAELTVGGDGGSGDLTWVNAFRIMRGWLDRLRLTEDGRAEFNAKFRVHASGIMKRYYGELLLSLAENWDVQAFWFDWRKDLNLAADALNVRINECFGDQPVHIVAHSMGGLAARTFIKNHSKRWSEMGKAEGLKAGGRLVMLGTPNHGSFAIPQVLTGIEGLVRKLALLDLRHNTSELLRVFNSFVGSYQMMPSPLVMPEVEDLYKAATYSHLNVPVSQSHLDHARRHHELLADVVDAARMVYIAGFDQPTFSGVKKDTSGQYALNDTEGYTMTFDGDGRVPHRLGLLERNGERVPAYYIREDHGNLSANAIILTALDELLETGETNDLYDKLEDAKNAAGVSRAARSGRAETPAEAFRRIQREDDARLQVSLRRMGNSRGFGAGRAPATDAEHKAEADAARKAEALEDETTQVYISPEERKVEETVTRGFLSHRGEDEEQSDDYTEYDAVIEGGSIEIGLAYGGIESIDYERTLSKAKYPVDAIAVGHYIGVRPIQAEAALDRAISAELKGGADAGMDQGILTEYTERGVIHGKLGQPFFLPDPRDRKGAARGRTRLIVLAGLGEPGRFGAPELTVLARELCWSLGRMQRQHLATVLIGSGVGNLKMREAVSAWMDGIRRSLTGSAYNRGRRLDRVTFVEINPGRYVDLDEMILREKERQAKRGFEIIYTELTAAQRARPRKDELNMAQEALNRRWEELEKSREEKERRAAGGARVDEKGPSLSPTRVTLSLDTARKVYRFGAITDIASVPERENSIDPAVVMQANDELAGEQSPRMQRERGRFLEELLMPNDLRAALYSQAPLVMLLDSTTARIHWEMVAQPSLANSTASGGASADDADGERFNPLNFLGTSRGFTRQLRTTYAPPPEPPPPPQRVLRVLVVADPAEDAHLPGAQEEGVAVADLFESYNSVYKEGLGKTRVEVKRLFGPLEATRTNVLRELMLRSYDVLHFAGHCVYRWDGDPTLSGWIFNADRRELLTANELTRIDRIPKFVFSNACESGITPDRSRERSVDLAPSFAEAFFARGVANFVCAAWPVDDAAARIFALTLYSALLGIKLDQADLDDGGGERGGEKEKERDGLSAAEAVARKKAQLDARRQTAVPMHEAMRDARVTIAERSAGRLTWGAYQHYGNPYFQFFHDTSQTLDASGPAAAKKGGVKRAAKSAVKGVAKGHGSKRAAAKKTGRKN
jgi:hypothetical protein